MDLSVITTGEATIMWGLFILAGAMPFLLFGLLKLEDSKVVFFLFAAPIAMAIFFLLFLVWKYYGFWGLLKAIGNFVWKFFRNGTE